MIVQFLIGRGWRLIYKGLANTYGKYIHKFQSEGDLCTNVPFVLNSRTFSPVFAIILLYVEANHFVPFLWSTYYKVMSLWVRLWAMTGSMHFFAMYFISWKTLFIVVGAKRVSFIVLSRRSVIDHDRFRPRTTGLHQAIVSIYWVGLLEPPWLLVIGVLRTNKLVLFLAS